MDYKLILGAVFVSAGMSIFLSHILLMPIFLRRVKTHNPRLYDAIDVGWLKLFDNFAMAWMWMFLFRERYRKLPRETHKLGTLLKYLWAFPWFAVAACPIAAALLGL
jgi:hypothetical protein